MKKITFNVDDDMHRIFKTCCSADGRKMTDVLKRFIERYCVHIKENYNDARKKT